MEEEPVNCFCPSQILAPNTAQLGWGGISYGASLGSVSDNGSGRRKGGNGTREDISLSMEGKQKGAGGFLTWFGDLRLPAAAFVV